MIYRYLLFFLFVFCALMIPDLCFAETSDAGHALHFDGSDYVDFGTTLALNPTSAFTIEAWVKSEASGWSNVLGRYNRHVMAAYALLIPGTNKFRFTVESPYREVNATQEIVLNKWIHVATTYDSSKIRLYLNGVLENSSNATNINETYVKTLIGAALDTGQPVSFFTGWIDEVRFWNTARTQSQIQDNMNISLTGEESGLVGYWRFDEGSGQTAGTSTSANVSGTLGASSSPGDDDPSWVISDAPIVYVPPTITPTSSVTPTITPTATITSTATSTPTTTPTLTMTPTPTITPTPTVTFTPTPTYTPGPPSRANYSPLRWEVVTGRVDESGTQEVYAPDVPIGVLPDYTVLGRSGNSWTRLSSGYPYASSEAIHKNETGYYVEFYTSSELSEYKVIFTLPCIEGDVNGDGRVNSTDVMKLGNNWHKKQDE